MKVLGIHDGHGSSVSILEDGVIIFAAEEERFSRIKGDSGFPSLAINYLIDETNYLDKVDRIVVASNSQKYMLMVTKRYPFFGVKEHIEENNKFWNKINNGKNVDYYKVMSNYVDKGLCPYPLESIVKPNNFQLIPQTIRSEYISNLLNFDQNKIDFVDHHSCHAYHAYYSSPYRGEDVLILTMDGSGDGLNATVSTVNKDGKIERIFKTNKCRLAIVYQYITLLLGMKPTEHEYKVMGLAAYAKEEYIQDTYNIFKETYYVDGLDFNSKVKIDNHYEYFKDKLEGYRFDAIAGGLQLYIEDTVIEWVKNWLERTGTSRIVFSGGMALNIKLSKKISEINQVDKIFVPFAGGDESLSIGASYYIHEKYSQYGQIEYKSSAYLSANYKSEDLIKAEQHALIKEQYTVFKNAPLSKVARIIADGNVVGIINGRMEFGPRALGHRSLVADPSKKSVVKRINETIKNRDFWMPFTPSILDRREADYIINPKKLEAPYMTMAFESTDLAKRDLAAAIHSYDGTVRVQLVNEKDSPDYYNLITEFEKISGIGGLLNTSLNIHGKPIVRTPAELIEEVLIHPRSRLHYIYIGKDLYIHNSMIH